MQQETGWNPESRVWPVNSVPIERVMRVVRLEVDQAKCVASGQCVFTAPEVFDQREDDGVVVLRTEEPDDALLPRVRNAEAQCPAAAIRLLNGSQG